MDLARNIIGDNSSKGDVLNYDNHPSIINLKQHKTDKKAFSFRKVSKEEVYYPIKTSNFKKPLYLESAKLRKLHGLVGRVGRVGAWVHGCVGGVGRKFAWVTWIAWVYKILAWVAWVGLFAWVAWVYEIVLLKIHY